MKGLTEIALVVDESGSMDKLKMPIVHGLNYILSRQKHENGSATMTIVKFSDNLRYLTYNENVESILPFDDNNYFPMGNTLLLDGIGDTIDSIGCRLADIEENGRPERVVVVIIADGEDKLSKNYDYESIASKIELQRSKYSWEFILIAVGPLSIMEARKLGIPKDRSYWVDATSEGVLKATEAINRALTMVRNEGSIGENWKF